MTQCTTVRTHLAWNSSQLRRTDIQLRRRLLIIMFSLQRARRKYRILQRRLVQGVEKNIHTSLQKQIITGSEKAMFYF